MLGFDASSDDKSDRKILSELHKAMAIGQIESIEEPIDVGQSLCLDQANYVKSLRSSCVSDCLVPSLK